jgi:hypothetical protein
MLCGPGGRRDGRLLRTNTPRPIRRVALGPRRRSSRRSARCSMALIGTVSPSQPPFHGCRSAMGCARAPADACCSSTAKAREESQGTPASVAERAVWPCPVRGSRYGTCAGCARSLGAGLYPGLVRGRPRLGRGAARFGIRPASLSARRRIISICALRLRNSSLAQRVRASWTAGSIRRRTCRRSLTCTASRRSRPAMAAARRRAPP